MSHRTDPVVDEIAICRRLMRSWWRNTPLKVSGRVAGTLDRDELWDRWLPPAMSSAHARLVQEIARLGGHYAHVHDESIDTRHD